MRTNPGHVTKTLLKDSDNHPDDRPAGLGSWAYLHHGQHQYTHWKPGHNLGYCTCFRSIRLPYNSTYSKYWRPPLRPISFDNFHRGPNSLSSTLCTPLISEQCIHCSLWWDHYLSESVTTRQRAAPQCNWTSPVKVCTSRPSNRKNDRSSNT